MIFTMLGDADKERYRRQLIIDGFGEEAQQKLSRSAVLIAGAGGLGCIAALYLAAAGIGRIRVADEGDVELSNLNRQVAYTERDIGRPKVQVLSAQLAALNPSVAVEPFHVTLDDESLPSLAAGCDVMIDALDNLPTRFAVNRLALRGNVAIVHGAVNGFYGQMTTVVPWETPCLACIYGNKVTSGITPVIGVTPGVIGLLQATEVMKVITGLGKQMRGRFLVFDGLQMSFTEIEIQRDPDCPACGSAFSSADS
jgi:molybdopterin-synthase adenylyltransferase